MNPFFVRVASARAAGVALALLLLILTAPARASLVIEGTRVIYPAGKKDITVVVVNPDARPLLMQAWLDTIAGGESKPDTAQVPFMLAPALTRIDPGESKNVRIVSLANTLPQDRESLFYLHVLGVPTKPEALQDDDNYLQVAVRSIIKLFYRPVGLDEIAAGKAPASLAWKLVPDKGGYALQAHNPTPYHVSFSQFSVDSGGKTIDDFSGGMVAPGQTVVVNTPLLTPYLGKDGIAIRYTYINDWGARIEQPLTTTAH